MKSVFIAAMVLCVLAITTNISSTQSTLDNNEQLQNEACGQSQDRSERTLNRVLNELLELKTAISKLNRPPKLEDCPASFTRINNSCYRVLTGKFQWARAGLRCRDIHPRAHLAVINNATKQSAVAAMLAGLLSSTSRLNRCIKSSGSGYIFWIGGQRFDPLRNTFFVWREMTTHTYDDNISFMGYTNWRSGQPDYNNNNQACLNMQSDVEYKWGDSNCDNKYCSVCEIKLD